MSPLTGTLYFVLILLAPIAFIGALVFLVVWLTNSENKKRNGAVELDQPYLAEEEVAHSPAEVLLEVYFSKVVAFFGFLGALALLGFGVLFLLLDPVTALVLGWWATLLGMLFVITFLKQLMTDKPSVILTTKYLEHAGWPFRRIPWSEITQAYTRRVSTGVYLCLELADQPKWLKQMGLVSRNMNRLNRIFFCSPININVTPLKANAADILAMVNQQLGNTGHLGANSSSAL